MAFPHKECKLSIVEKAWARSDGQFRFLATSQPPGGQWTEYRSETSEPIFPLGNQYFSVLTFKGARRSNETTADNCALLWADLDNQRDEQWEWMERYVPPSVLWETSPGMFQALWYLSDYHPTDEVVELNRALTRAVGADSGGWFASKMLRVPETLNWKRAQENADGLFVPRGRIVRETDSTFLYTDLKQRLLPFQEAPRPVGTPRMRPPLPTKAAWRETAKRLRLNTRDLTELNAPANGDRSTQLWRAARWLHKRGATAEEIYTLLWYARYNKWIDRPDKLWADVLKAST